MKIRCLEFKSYEKRPIICFIYFSLFTFHFSLGYAQSFPLQTIEEVQLVANPAANDQSPLVGDTIEVRGLITSDIRALGGNNGWGCFVVDPNLPGNPWQGLLIVQQDTTVGGTDFGFLLPGDICRFTGVVEEFETTTRLQILTNPLTPIVLENIGNPPAAIALGTADLTDAQNGEQWEGQLVRIENAVIVDNNASSNRAIIEDNSNLPAFIDDGFAFFGDMFDNGSYNWPAVGTTVRASGFVQGLSDGYSVNPRDFNDFILLNTVPLIENVQRDLTVPTSTDPVIVSATVTDNGSVADVSLHYSIDNGAWQVAAMTANGDLWTGNIPEQTNGSFLRYFLSAQDNDGLMSQFPADTSRATGTIFRYFVRNNGLQIADVQNDNGYRNGDSPYENFTVTLEGVVMSGSAQFQGYFIQEAAAAWSGIFVRDPGALYNIGDLIEVRGRITENFGFTEMQVILDTLVMANFGPFEAVPSQTGDLTTDGPLDEAFESVLVFFDNITVTDAYPDLPNNFGEFIIDDGSGGYRVDDESEQYDGNLWDGVDQGAMGNIRGIHIYTFSKFKLAPRDSNDVNLALVGIDDSPAIPGGFALHQNYPNPFNPKTDIRYQISDIKFINLVVFDALGKKVRTLVNKQLSPGSYSVTWDGRGDTGNPMPSGVYFYRLKSGKQQLTRRMLLIR